MNKKCIDMDNYYIATEKIHGSNMSIVVDKDRNINYGKRTAFLTKEEQNQVPWHTIVDYAHENKSTILKWFETVCDYAKEHGTIEQVIFFGELFGEKTVKGSGAYVANSNNEREIRFFDIHVVFSDDKRLVLSYDKMVDIIGGNKTAPVLRGGPLRELILTTTELNSELGDCLAEGQVYRPKDEYMLIPDNLGHVNSPVVKHKYDAWLEKKNIKTNHNMNYTADEIKASVAIESRITRQRLLNILSHGEIDPIDQNTGLFIKTMSNDIKDEISREEPELANASNKLIKKYGGQIAKLYRNYMEEI